MQLKGTILSILLLVSTLGFVYGQTVRTLMDDLSAASRKKDYNTVIEIAVPPANH